MRRGKLGKKSSKYCVILAIFR